MTDRPDPTEPELAARLDRAAGRVRGRAVTEASVAARVTTRARHRRQARAGIGAMTAALLLVVGIAVANGGGDNGETVRAAGSPTSSSEAPSDCGSGSPASTPTDPVPHEVAFESAVSLISGDLFTPGQAHAVLAGKPLMVTDAQASYLKSNGLDPAHPTTTSTMPQPPLKPGQTPYEAWMEAFREAGLLTPEQEAQIEAGDDIDVTPEMSALFREKFGGANPESQMRAQVSVYVAVVEAHERDRGSSPSFANPCSTDGGLAADSGPDRKRAELEADLAETQACLSRSGIDAKWELDRSGESAGWSFGSLDPDSAQVSNAFRDCGTESRERASRSSSAPTDSQRATRSELEPATVRLRAPDWHASFAAGSRSELAGSSYSVQDGGGAPLESGNFETHGEAIIIRTTSGPVIVTVSSKADGSPCRFVQGVTPRAGETVDVSVDCDQPPPTTTTGP